MNKTIKLCMAFACFLVLIGSVYATYWVYSSVVTVRVDYTLTLDYTQNETNITLTATLKDKDSTPMAEKSIVFYKCSNSDGTIESTLATVSTDQDGKASIVWEAKSNGTYYFKAGYHA